MEEEMTEPMARAIAQGAEINRLLSEVERLQSVIRGLEKGMTAKNLELRKYRIAARNSNARAE